VAARLTRLAWMNAVLLVASFTTAYAKCPWVLWVRVEEWVVNDIEARDEGMWEPRSVHETERQCLEPRQAQARSTKPDVRIRREWLYKPEAPAGHRELSSAPIPPCPDAIDPSGTFERWRPLPGAVRRGDGLPRVRLDEGVTFVTWALATEAQAIREWGLAEIVSATAPLGVIPGRSESSLDLTVTAGGSSLSPSPRAVVWPAVMRLRRDVLRGQALAASAATTAAPARSLAERPSRQLESRRVAQRIEGPSGGSG
jgi:hypothetical protein